MKKILPVLIVILAAIGIGYNFISRDQSTSAVVTANATPFPTLASAANGTNTGDVTSENGNDEDLSLEGDKDSSGVIDEVKPAAVAYKSADEALAAIKKGAGDYDDQILEQFTNPGDDCTFCGQLYSDLKELLVAPSTKNEEKAFYAEILAISGRVDNVKNLVDGYKGSASTENKEVYSAALELVTGKDDVVKYLGSELSTDNPDLRESVVAAMTNQGGSLAFDTMFKHVISTNNPDGYYSIGAGPAEMILNEEGLSKAQEFALKRDAYSPLAVKAMLNSGMQGIKYVMDILGSSNDLQSNNKLIEGGVDHVGYDEQVEAFMKEKLNDPNPAVSGFAKKVLDDYASQENAVDQEPVEDEAPMSKMNP